MSFNIEVAGGTSARLSTKGKYCDRDIVVTATGGGGSSLNFNIVGNPQPDNPKENTLWVDTDVDITGWDFKVTTPDNPIAGMVWVLTGKYSTAAFNAIKENSIHIYPVRAYQYINGNWEEKDALLWQNGEWKEWAWFLYTSELEYVKYGGTNANLTIDGDVVRFAPPQSSNSNWAFAFKDPIDVTDKHFLRATIDLTKGVQSGYSGIAICSKLPTTYSLASIIASHYASELGVTELEIPLSNVTGTVYVCARSTYATGSITNFRLV